MNLLAVFGLMISAVIFASTLRVPIMYLFSSTIAMATSLYMFNYHATGAESHEEATFLMYGFIFIAVAAWQILEAIRAYYD